MLFLLKKEVQEIKQAIKIVDQSLLVYEENKDNHEYADAFLQYGDFFVRHRKCEEMVVECIGYGIKCLLVARKVYEQAIKKMTNGTVRQLDAFQHAENQTYKIMVDYYKTFMLMSYWDFESYVIFLESLREPTKRFYEPRRHTLKSVVKDLQDLENDKYKFYGLSMPSRVGKLVADNEPVLTSNGWKNHGDLVVGDYVFGLNGELRKVTYVHPKHVANKRVWFSDGEHVDCHANHEWVLYDRNLGKEVTVETNVVERKLMSKEGNKYRCRWHLPIKQPLVGSKQELRVPPYVLGAWLGDGTNKSPLITICDTDNAILDSVVECGYEYTTSYKQVGCTAYSFKNLRADLQEYGMCHSRETTEKHIPDEYLSAPFEDRLELLAGLLDTDGTLVKKENRYRFSTINERLKDDFVSLVSTFGWRVCVTKQEAKTSSSGIVGKHDVYSIGFNPTFEIPCRVERKQLKTFSKQRRISVEKIEDIEPVEGNCITVDGGIYRVGRRMTPTHNSTICIFFLTWVAMRKPNSCSAMGGHSGILAKGFYKENMNVFTTEEYTFQDMYYFWNPWCKMYNMPSDQSAEDLTINLGEHSRFSTLTMRGIDGTWTGKQYVAY